MYFPIYRQSSPSYRRSIALNNRVANNSLLNCSRYACNRFNNNTLKSSPILSKVISSSARKKKHIIYYCIGEVFDLHRFLREKVSWRLEILNTSRGKGVYTHTNPRFDLWTRVNNVLTTATQLCKLAVLTIRSSERLITLIDRQSVNSGKKKKKEMEKPR